MPAAICFCVISCPRMEKTFTVVGRSTVIVTVPVAVTSTLISGVSEFRCVAGSAVHITSHTGGCAGVCAGNAVGKTDKGNDGMFHLECLVTVISPEIGREKRLRTSAGVKPLPKRCMSFAIAASKVMS